MQPSGFAPGLQARRTRPAPPSRARPAGAALDPAEAAEAVAAAEKRAAEIRAEAALLVETVEDRAHEEVEAARAEAAKHSREVERLTAELSRMRSSGGGRQ